MTFTYYSSAVAIMWLLMTLYLFQQIPDLQSNTCYQFLVYVTNNQGVGQPSPTSEQYCTLPESSEHINNFFGSKCFPMIISKFFITSLMYGDSIDYFYLYVHRFEHCLFIGCNAWVYCWSSGGVCAAHSGGAAAHLLCGHEAMEEIYAQV